MVITDAQIERAQVQAADLRKAHDTFETALATNNCDAGTHLSAEDGIAGEAMRMADLLRKPGLYKPVELKGEPGIEAIEPRHYTTAAFVEDVTGGPNWNK
ncbi:hypothetical protein ACWF2L_21565 [Streptomyces anulatus]